jgi:cytochrome c556
MTNFSNLLGMSAAILLVLSGMAVAGSHLEAAVKARQALMQLRGFDIGQLGAMAQGKMPYDADAANAAAGNLMLTARYDASKLWPQGTSTEELGKATAALPEIWTTYPAVVEADRKFIAAMENLVANAGTLEGLQGSIGALGKSCGACHNDFRQKRD